MTFERREELISAFLDGELAPEERAQVEKWLAESPELRQLRDELAALGGSLRALPRHQLDRSLGEIVLRRAERAVLGDDAERPIAGKVGPSTPVSTWWSRGAGWWRLAWPALAVAAALVIMFLTSDERPGQRQVAQAPKEQGAIAARDQKPGAPAQRADEYTAEKAAPNARKQAHYAVDLVQSEATAPAGAPAPASEVVGDRRARAAPSDSLGLAIVCDVTPEFLQEQAFEKLATRLNLAAIAAEPVRLLNLAPTKDEDKPALAEKVAEPSARLVRQSFIVDATDEQMARLVAELRKNATQVKKVRDERKFDVKQETDRGENTPSRKYRFLLQVPAAAPVPPADSGDQP